MAKKERKQKKALHGNRAKIDPASHVESLNQTNMAVMEGKTRDPDIRDDMAESAREFVEENKK